MTRPTDTLPPSLAPRGLRCAQAAAYIAVSPTLWGEMVKDGRMPQPKHINRCVVWDRIEIDEAFAALPGDDETNPWDTP